MPSWKELFVASLCITYLLTPLLHHAGFTDGYFYIGDADNFFTRRVWLQLLIWLVSLLLAAAVTWLRQHQQNRLSRPLPSDAQAARL